MNPKTTVSVTLTANYTIHLGPLKVKRIIKKEKSDE